MTLGCGGKGRMFGKQTWDTDKQFNSWKCLFLKNGIFLKNYIHRGIFKHSARHHACCDFHNYISWSVLHSALDRWVGFNKYMCNLLDPKDSPTSSPQRSPLMKNQRVIKIRVVEYIRIGYYRGRGSRVPGRKGSKYFWKSGSLSKSEENDLRWEAWNKQ